MSEQENDAYLRGYEIDRKNATGTAAAKAASMQKNDQADASAEVRQAPYVHIGQAFADWFNDKVRQLPNPSVTLGTKQAHAIELRPDGRLECVLVGATGEDAKQFVAFEGRYLDQLVRKIGALGL